MSYTSYMAQDPLFMRASAQDRYDIESVLTTGFQDGRLSSTELGDRLSLLHEAKTYLDLRNLVDDLPHSLSFLDPNPVPEVHLEKAQEPDRSVARHRVRVALLVYVALFILLSSGGNAFPLLVVLLGFFWFRRQRRSHGYSRSTGLFRPIR
ncbi:MAG: DUF1707 SHOCT-like domain-containing protein [Ferrimicrobium sp.]